MDLAITRQPPAGSPRTLRGSLCAGRPLAGSQDNIGRKSPIASRANRPTRGVFGYERGRTPPQVHWRYRTSDPSSGVPKLWLLGSDPKPGTSFVPFPGGCTLVCARANRTLPRGGKSRAHRARFSVRTGSRDGAHRALSAVAAPCVRFADGRLEGPLRGLI
jgi:hypothetical protein